ncbi:MAG: hypothetical protein KGQ58_09420 [Proteobacteria bacterium]|nr:hypothetical protein [Pseudomonadota bacterium]
MYYSATITTPDQVKHCMLCIASDEDSAKLCAQHSFREGRIDQIIPLPEEAQGMSLEELVKKYP